MKKTYRVHFLIGELTTACGLYCGSGRHTVTDDREKITCQRCSAYTHDEPLKKENETRVSSNAD